MWVGEIKPNQAISNPCLLFIWVVVIGPILVSIDLIALAMAMAISAEQPVMPSSLAAKRREQGGTCRCCMCWYYDIVHRVCHSIIYIYISCSTLVRKCSEFQELPLKDLSDLAFAMRFAIRDVIRWLL